MTISAGILALIRSEVARNPPPTPNSPAMTDRGADRQQQNMLVEKPTIGRWISRIRADHVPEQRVGVLGYSQAGRGMT